VHFDYLPGSFLLGAGISGVTLLLLGLIGVTGWRRQALARRGST
jgi:hypothetical protein